MAAEIVDKILRGAKPGDIPVEEPTNFDLVVDLHDREGARFWPSRRRTPLATTADEVIE